MLYFRAIAISFGKFWSWTPCNFSRPQMLRVQLMQGRALLKEGYYLPKSVGDPHFFGHFCLINWLKCVFLPKIVGTRAGTITNFRGSAGTI